MIGFTWQVTPTLWPEGNSWLFKQKFHRVTSATWLGRTYLMYNPLSITTIWHPSMDTSAFVGAVGSSTIYQRIQKGSCLADLLGNVHTDLGPGCGSYSGPWTGSSRSHPWYGSPWKTLSQTIIHRMTGDPCGSPGSREEILALCWNKKYMLLDVLAWVRGTALTCIIPPLRWHS